MLHTADVDPTLRPTELTLDHFRALANAYAGLCSRDPGLIAYEFREELRLKRATKKPGSKTDPRAPPCLPTEGG